MQKSITILPLNTPLLDAIDDILANDFSIVTDGTKQMCGIVTTADISEQYIRWTKPLMLLEQIENHIRMLMEGKFLLEDIQKIARMTDLSITSIILPSVNIFV